MPDVTEATAEVGQMILQAIQNTFGMGPDAAIAQAQADTGVTDAQVGQADMGQVFDYMCGQPGLSPEVQSYLSNASSNYNAYGNVSQSGSSYSGGGSGGGYSGGGSASNAQIVQQVTQNYTYQDIDDNHIDILGPVSGDIDIDQDNDSVDVHGDGNAVNTGEGDQNAATGAGSSAAQANDGGDAMSNSGDGAAQGGEGSTVNSGDGAVVGSDVEGPLNTGTFYGNQVGEGSVSDSPVTVGTGNTVGDDNAVGHGSTVLDNHDGGQIDDSSLGFGSGNVQGDVYNETGAANSNGGDAHGNGLDLNFGSNVEHGPGDLNADQPSSGGQPALAQSDDETHLQLPEHEAVPTHEAAAPEHEEVHHEAAPEHLAPQVEAPAEEHDAGAMGGDEHHVM